MLRRIFHLGRYQPSAGEEVQLELEHHLEQSTRDFERQGLSPDEARRAALAAFGDRSTIEAQLRGLRETTVRERLTREWWAEFRQDLRVAWRGLWRTPGFTLVALLTLALGIGANSAIFGVVRSVLLRPLPYPESGQLVQLWTDYRAQNGRTEPEWLTPPDFADWRERNRTFEAMAAYGGWGPDLTGAGDPVTLNGLAVSGDWFRMLGVEPALGRSLLPSDDDAGSERAVVLSDGLWRQRFGADPAILGRAIQLNGEPWTVVGVMPRSFRAPLAASQPEAYRTFRRPADSRCGRGCITLRAIGRLKPGVSLPQAQADLAALSRDIAERFPETNKGVAPWLVPLQQQLTGPTREPLLALSGAIGLVLLIACANLASLLLVRGESRARELAVRSALGAGRGRLVRQLLVESLLLASLGGALGLGLGMAATRALASIVPESVRAIQELRTDGTVLLFTAGITLAAALLFGVLPALRSAGGSPMVTIRGGSRGGRGAGRLLDLLVVGELALAVTLLTGAGLLLRSFVQMQRVDLGYRTDRGAMVQLALPRARYPDSTVTVAMDGLLATLRANPSIRTAEVSDVPPMIPGDQDVSALAVGEPVTPGTPGSVWYRSVTPGYRAFLGYRLVSGRDFTPADRAGAPSVGVVNEEAARRFWGNHDPVGRVLRLGSDSDAPAITIVGVVGTARHDGPNQHYKAELYLPIAQAASRGVTIFLDTPAGRAAAVTAFRAALKEFDPLLPAGEMTSLADQLRESTAPARLNAVLIGGFAAVALLLAMVGVYGVMAYAVAQREREIGVRLALGASPAGIRRLVLGRGGRLALAGTASGLVLALALAHTVRSLLFGVSVYDWQALVGGPLLLAGITLLASWIPARRAVRLDPLVAIRAE